MNTKYSTARTWVMVLLLTITCATANCQLTMGGYGEIAMTRNMFSDNINRYTHAADYKDANSHGRFDMPHVAFALGYGFTSKWHIYSEVEYEHGGTESAVELEAEEAGEYEQEIERGGEVYLEQLYVEYRHNDMLNLRIGHIVVPVGYTNPHHLPNQFFSMYRPAGEATILPCTWHQTGIAMFGMLGKWKYEVQALPALNSDLFGSTTWVGSASASPYEFTVANKYAGLLRIDNYSVAGLRIGAALYYGHSFGNVLQPPTAQKYKEINGETIIGSIDMDYKGNNVIARAWGDYGHLTDSYGISIYNRSRPKTSTSKRQYIGSDALACGGEVGYDVFAHNAILKQSQKLYLYAHYEYYDSMYGTAQGIRRLEWCSRHILGGGVNYFPVPQVVIKAEYSYAFLAAAYNNEPSITLGAAFCGFFK